VISAPLLSAANKLPGLTAGLVSATGGGIPEGGGGGPPAAFGAAAFGADDGAADEASPPLGFQTSPVV